MDSVTKFFTSGCFHEFVRPLGIPLASFWTFWDMSEDTHISKVFNNPIINTCRLDAFVNLVTGVVDAVSNHDWWLVSTTFIANLLSVAKTSTVIWYRQLFSSTVSTVSVEKFFYLPMVLTPAVNHELWIPSQISVENRNGAIKLIKSPKEDVKWKKPEVKISWHFLFTFPVCHCPKAYNFIFSLWRIHSIFDTFVQY
jgi:hypothetical protein